MIAEIVEKAEILLAGYNFYGDPFASSSAWTEENEIGRLWKRFGTLYTARKDEIPDNAVPGLGYEVHIWTEDTFATGHYEVFVGFKIPYLTPIPVDLSIKLLPPARYAVFSLAGPIITEDWTRRLSAEWLPENDLIQTGNFSFNLYDEKFKGMDRIDESEIRVYVPVE